MHVHVHQSDSLGINIPYNICIVNEERTICAP